MATRKQLPAPDRRGMPADAGDAPPERAQRLVLRSGAEGSAVTFARRRTAPAGDVDAARPRARRGPAEKRWLPPESLTPEEVTAVIAAAGTERDRLLLRVLWATGGRVSEVLALRAQDVRRDALVLPNLKNPARPVKTVFLSAGDQDLPGELLLFQKAEGLADGEPLFASRKRGAEGRVRAIGRIQAWRIVKDASARAQVRVLALRASREGQAGAPAPVHPHLFRHARVRQIVRQTKSLPLAQKQAGWSRLQLAYLTLGDDEARALMRRVDA
jgi:integrase